MEMKCMESLKCSNIIVIYKVLTYLNQKEWLINILIYFLCIVSEQLIKAYLNKNNITDVGTSLGY